jgi:hypothetical protein
MEKIALGLSMVRMSDHIHRLSVEMACQELFASPISLTCDMIAGVRRPDGWRSPRPVVR